jgi:hypothetical protein
MSGYVYNTREIGSRTDSAAGRSSDELPAATGDMVPEKLAVCLFRLEM